MASVNALCAPAEGTGVQVGQSHDPATQALHSDPGERVLLVHGNRTAGEIVSLLENPSQGNGAVVIRQGE